MTNSTVELGDRVRDRITGFEGIVTGLTKWLTGCDSAVVTPAVLDNGKPVGAEYFDVGRIEIVRKGAVPASDVATVRENETRPGGPSSIERGALR